MNEPSRLRNQWIVLRLVAHEGAFYLNYEDDRGTRRAPAEQHDPMKWTLFLPTWLHAISFSKQPAPEVFVPADLNELLQETLKLFPAWQTGPHATGPVPAPVFVDPLPELWGLPWEMFVQDLLPPAIDKNRLQLVRLAREKRVERSSFRLPVQITTIGSRCESALQLFRSSSWYTASPNVQQYGILFETLQTGETKLFRERFHDIVIAEEHDVGEEAT